MARSRPSVGEVRNRGQGKVAREIASVEQRYHAAALFVSTGNMAEVERQTSIPYQTLMNWKKSQWFIDAVEELKSQRYDQLDSRLASIVDKATKIVEERLVEGDVKMLRDGTTVTVPVDAKTASTILQSSFNQMQVVNNRPTSISANMSVDERLNQLQEKFKSFMKAKEINGEYQYEDEDSSSTGVDASEGLQ